MISVVFPKPDFKLKIVSGVQYIWDDLRKKWLVLTPEEWVRRNFISYLITNCHYPKSLISQEKELRIGDLKKRYDIVVYKDAIPWILVECKQADVALSEKVWMQAVRYNMQMHVPYMVITNGNNTQAWKLHRNRFEELNALPNW